jgi:hypothetical protein
LGFRAWGLGLEQKLTGKSFVGSWNADVWRNFDQDIVIRVDVDLDGSRVEGILGHALIRRDCGARGWMKDLVSNKEESKGELECVRPRLLCVLASADESHSRLAIQVKTAPQEEANEAHKVRVRGSVHLEGRAGVGALRYAHPLQNFSPGDGWTVGGILTCSLPALLRGESIKLRSIWWQMSGRQSAGSRLCLRRICVWSSQLSSS